MFKAIDESGKEIRIDDASNDIKYYCPICHGLLKVRAKKSETVATHFAHKTLKDCDTFTHDMSDWHTAWQSIFPIRNQEVPLPFDKPCHRADVLACGYVIEFQHSPLSVEEFDERNRFYTSLGKKVVWVFDVSEKFQEVRINKIQYMHYGKKISKYITGNTISPVNAELHSWARSGIISSTNYSTCIGYQYEYGNSSSVWHWKRPFNTLIHYHPQINKDVIIFLEMRSGLLQKLIWCDDVVDKDKAFSVAYGIDYMCDPSAKTYIENREKFVIKSDFRSFSATEYKIKDFLLAIKNRQL